MIIGIGTDITHIPRIQSLMDNPHFLTKIYTEDEITRAMSIRHEAKRAGFLAKRFAAKEAFAKALRTGIGSQLAFTDIHVNNSENGAPNLHINDRVIAYLYAEFPTRDDFTFHLSLSDDADIAQAFVVIEAI